MKNNKLEFKSPDDVEAVYYEAFRHCDLEVMSKLWADEDVILVHPGSSAIVGHEAVMRSWAHIFTGAELPEVKVTVVKRTVNDGLAVHLVVEQVATGENISAAVLATNIYQKFESGWLMIEHHGSIVHAKQEGQTLQ